jgi:protein-disulfide isomerase
MNGWTEPRSDAHNPVKRVAAQSGIHHTGAMTTRRTLLLGIPALALSPRAFAQGAEPEAPEPHTIPIELVEETLELEAAVRLGSRGADAIIIEYFDYNCPWCRRSAQHLDTLLESDRDLSYILVNFAVLGAPSVQATKVALAFAQLAGPSRYREFHRRMFTGRGVVDGERALGIAQAMGQKRAPLIALADSTTIRDRMTESLRVGNSLGLVATPSFVIGPKAFIGHMPLDAKRAEIAAARA